MTYNGKAIGKKIKVQGAVKKEKRVDKKDVERMDRRFDRKRKVRVRKEQENQNSKRQQVTQKILEIPEFALPQQAVGDESKNIFQGNISR